MNHLSSDQVWAYLDNDMTSEEQMNVSNHLLTCAPCERKVEAVKETAMRIQTAFVTSVPPASLRLHQQVLTSLNQMQETTKGHRKARARRRFLPAMPFVAVAVLAIAVLSFSHQNGGYDPFRSLFRHPSGTGTPGATAVFTHSTAVNSSSSTVALGSGGDASGTGAGASANISNGSPSLVNLSSGPLHLASEARDTLTGKVSIKVTDSVGTPVANAHVAFVANGRIIGSFSTDAGGNLPDRQLTVPVDLVSAVTSNLGHSTPQGDVTVVVWKTGYEPVVSYDVNVFAEGQGDYQQAIVLTSGLAQSVQEIGYGYSRDALGGYNSATMRQWIAVVQSSVLSAGSGGSSATGSSGAQQVENLGEKQATTDESMLSATVTDESGSPVSGAHVAVVMGTAISGWTVTGSSGEAPAIATKGVSDWRLQGPWVVEGGPKVAAIVVWKDGFAPAVSFYQPIPVGGTRNLHVTLESLAWRRAHGWTNITDPSLIPGERLPSEADALRLFTWVSQSSN